MDINFSLLFCLCLTFDIYIHKEKINYILIKYNELYHLIKQLHFGTYIKRKHKARRFVKKP